MIGSSISSRVYSTELSRSLSGCRIRLFGSGESDGQSEDPTSSKKGFWEDFELNAPRTDLTLVFYFCLRSKRRRSYYCCGSRTAFRIFRVCSLYTVFLSSKASVAWKHSNCVDLRASSLWSTSQNSNRVALNLSWWCWRCQKLCESQYLCDFTCCFCTAKYTADRSIVSVDLVAEGSCFCMSFTLLQ